ncbi:hypothetical protein [Litorihabitans aurantiacus]|uniref:Uncharacterized protein n=1 Tax=Litorihabitans aurantiacus TaxID=1930061 RepID=A0AA38CSP8_9MICO|nr:hypothetical protein [Litorihabitans aurantiacus]GMA33668.1 hypothetical protein GCM10025875_36600 [Litorihabitans aurantiacus]GMA33737.1 hypothetical protein GCM10025875_37290 [Litorihabitans aurantiacus]
MSTTGLTTGRAVYALAAGERGTCLAPGIITRRFQGERDTFVTVRYLRPVRGDVEHTYGLAHDCVTPREKATYGAADECIDCGSHTAAPHAPACPFA